MKKHRKKLALAGAVLVLALILILVLGGKNREPDAKAFDSLELQINGQFQYGGLAWGSASDTVRSQLEGSFKFDVTRAPFPVNGAFYILDEQYKLAGQRADILLDFYDDKLTVARLSFRLEGEYEQWFSQLTEHLQQCYGPAQETLNTVSPETGIATTGYKWDTENTTLQVVLQQGETRDPSATISMGIR